MTNYNERLDGILTTCDFEPEDFNSSICKWCGERKGVEIHTAKQAITSLIKELVAEAKPKTMPSNLSPENYEKCERVVDQFEQNLLKELEEV